MEQAAAMLRTPLYPRPLPGALAACVGAGADRMICRRSVGRRHAGRLEIVL